MITLEYQTFLSQEWSIRLMDSGVDMSDSRYLILEGKDELQYVLPRTEKLENTQEVTLTPTYTLPELLYKLSEYIEGFGELRFYKDAPFYIFGYYGKGNPLESNDEYPIESAARLLLMCAKEDLGYVSDITGK